MPQSHVLAHLCLFLVGVAICFCYINQTFLFSACVAINETRVNSKRHFICCHKTKSKTEMKQEGFSKSRIFCCSGIPPKSRKDVEGFQEKGVRKYLSKFVLFTPVKCIVLVLFSCYLGVSIWGATNLQQGLVVKDLVAEDSYFYKYQTWEDDVFPYSVPVSLVIDKPYQYSNSETQRNIDALETDALDNKLIASASPVSWLNTYRSALSFYRNSSEVDFINGLSTFLQQPQYASFQNDVVIKGQSITASRFYVFTTFIDNTQDRGKMMQNIRETAKHSPLSVIAFSPTFIFYEQYVAILPQTLQTLGAGLAAVFLVTIIFMPHPVLLLFVVFTMGMIMTGIIGFLHFWKLTLSSVTMIHLIMCVGFSVDFTAHICHAYMIANGSNRNERVSVALTSSGGPIFNGAVSSVLGILMLSIAKSYIFRSFFEVMLLVIIFGASHALFFLPVILSLFGPDKARSVDQNGSVNNGMDMSNVDAKKIRTDSQETLSNCRVSSPSPSQILSEPFKIPRPSISRSPLQ